MAENTKTAKQKLLELWRSWRVFIIVTLSLLALIWVTGFRIVNVDGDSMVPTLINSEKLILTNFFYTPQNGDIIVIKKGAELDTIIIKRVIATEGQSLRLDYENDKIYVDGKELDEPYLTTSTFGGLYGDTEIPDVIPEGKLFVLGDNRPISKDSRTKSVGLIDKADVMGKAQLAFFPFDRFGLL